MPADIPESVVEKIQSYLDSHPYLGWIGFEVQALKVGMAKTSVTYDENIANLGGPRGLHGGVSSTAVDVAGALALATTFEDPASAVGQGSIATADLNVSYFRPATDDIELTSEVVYSGESKGVARTVVEKSTETGSKIVAGRGTYRLFK
jgi:uncharacterized protein (TIGR00369 family)